MEGVPQKLYCKRGKAIDDQDVQRVRRDAKLTTPRRIRQHLGPTGSPKLDAAEPLVRLGCQAHLVQRGQVSRGAYNAGNVAVMHGVGSDPNLFPSQPCILRYDLIPFERGSAGAQAV